MVYTSYFWNMINMKNGFLYFYPLLAGVYIGVISELLKYKNIETPRIRIHCTPESHILMSGLKTKKAAERKYKGRHFNIGEGTERIFEAFPPPESRLEFTQLPR